MKPFWFIFILSVSVPMCSHRAQAQALYDYTDGTLTAEVELGAKLSPGTSTVTPASLVLSAGGTLDLQTGVEGAPFGEPQSTFALQSSLFQFTVDAAGNVTGWNMDLTAVDGPDRIETLTIDSSARGDTVSWIVLGNSGEPGFTQVNHYTAGAWHDPPLPAPEVSASGGAMGFTFLAGIVAIITGSRRWRGGVSRRP